MPRSPRLGQADAELELDDLELDRLLMQPKPHWRDRRGFVLVAIWWPGGGPKCPGAVS